MKIALITDQHFGIRNDNVKFIDYYRKFYNNIFFPTIEKYNIDTIIDLGDSFDRRKYINFFTLQSAQEMFYDKLRDKNITVHSIVGNHNDYFKNTNDCNSVDLLLGGYKNVISYSEPADINIDGLDICMLPWITSDNQKQCLDHINNTKSQVLMGHLELVGFEWFRGSVSDHGDDPDLFKKFDLVYSGHYHHKSTKGNITYLGAPYEMIWSDWNDDKGFHIFDTDTRELTYIKNPYNIFHKIWYNDNDIDTTSTVKDDFSHLNDCFVKLIIKDKTNPYWFDMFVEKIEKAGPAHLQVVEDHLHLDLEDDGNLVDEAEDTLTILNKYVDSITNSNTDKQALSQLMRDLYTEALNTI